jgi:hypothetical protein
LKSFEKSVRDADADANEEGQPIHNDVRPDYMVEEGDSQRRHFVRE